MQYDTVILGAGAAGMFCASHCGRRVLVIDHAKAAGEKIRISGGGRCNFTNMYCEANNFLGENRHFHKSALARYSQWDFIDLITRHGIAYHEKTLGQLFCDDSARQIVDMLRQEMQRAGAELWLQTAIQEVVKTDSGFRLQLMRDGKATTVSCRDVVVATGGKSIPKMGSTGLAYQIAEQFNHPVVTTRPGLVPLTFPDGQFTALAGVALPVRATARGFNFDEAMLFTHRGLSGPAILQISSYWREGKPISLNLCPQNDLFQALRAQRQVEGRKQLTTIMARHLPGRLVEFLAGRLPLAGNLADQSDEELRAICDHLSDWQLVPSGSEGYRTAEVTVGGVDTDFLSSKTMMSKTVEGLYFVGECVDVTGWLGGFNFQWAWSSGMAAARHLSAKAA